MNTRKVSVAFTGTLGIFGAAMAQDTRPAVAGKVAVDDVYPQMKATFPGGVTSYPDLTYAVRSGYRPLKLDLYLPPASFASKGPRPFVVFIHGGGWSGGDKR